MLRQTQARRRHRRTTADMHPFVGTIGSTLLMMAYWFAPLLAGWAACRRQAMFFSFVACWRNWRAFCLRYRPDADGDGAGPADRPVSASFAHPSASLPAIVLPVIFIPVFPPASTPTPPTPSIAPDESARADRFVRWPLRHLRLNPLRSPAPLPKPLALLFLDRCPAGQRFAPPANNAGCSGSTG